jgi:hypothetical protein
MGYSGDVQCFQVHSWGEFNVMSKSEFEKPERLLISTDEDGKVSADIISRLDHCYGQTVARYVRSVPAAVAERLLAEALREAE